MSHFPGTRRYYQPNYAFDRWSIEELQNGHSDSFLDLSVEQLDEVGNTEMLPWAVALGAAGPQHMELLSYQPTPHHGHAVVIFHAGEARAAAAPRPFHFENHPYAFYRHPSIRSYPLNKLLYDSRWKRELRLRMLRDIEAVSSEYGLSPNEAATLREVCKFPHNNTDRPALDADPLVELGAHPVGALMAVHVLQAEQRRLQKTCA